MEPVFATRELEQDGIRVTFRVNDATTTTAFRGDANLTERTCPRSRRRRSNRWKSVAARDSDDLGAWQGERRIR
jgi:hypothetical protein